MELCMCKKLVAFRQKVLYFGPNYESYAYEAMVYSLYGWCIFRGISDIHVDDNIRYGDVKFSTNASPCQEKHLKTV